MVIRQVNLSDDGKEAVEKLQEYLAKAKEKYGENLWEDKDERFDFVRFKVPGFRNDVSKMVETLSIALGAPKSRVPQILRTKTLGKSLTGPAKGQYFVSLEKTGQTDPSITDGNSVFPFQPGAAYDSPEPTYIDGGVELIVLAEARAD